jgi:hypothetical protein
MTEAEAAQSTDTAPPLAPTGADSQAPSPPPPPPAPPRRRAGSGAPPAPPPAAAGPAPDAALAELLARANIDPEQWAAFEKHQREYEAKRPEIDRIRQEHRQLTSRVATLQQQAEQHRRAYEQQVEQNFALTLRGLAADIGREINLVPEAVASDDLFQLIYSKTAPTDDGAVVFREGKVEIDMSDPDARKKLGEHIAKTRAHWLASRLAAGGGGTGLPASRASLPSARAEAPKTRDEMVAAITQRIVTRGNGTHAGQAR